METKLDAYFEDKEGRRMYINTELFEKKFNERINQARNKAKEEERKEKMKRKRQRHKANKKRAIDFMNNNL